MKRSEKSITIPINISAEQAWNIIGAVGGVDQWFSAVITSCRIEGDKRICGTADGEFEEDILKVDHENYVFQYAIPRQHLLPVENILGTMQVHRLGENRSQITWNWAFDVDRENEQEVLSAFEGMGQMGIKGIEEYALKQAA